MSHKVLCAVLVASAMGAPLPHKHALGSRATGRHTLHMFQWFSGRLMLLIFVCLQCGVFHLTFFFLLQPCAVTNVEVFFAPVVGIVGLFLIVFADRVQARVLQYLSLATCGSLSEHVLTMRSWLCRVAGLLLAA